MSKTKKSFWLDVVLFMTFIAAIISGFVLDHQNAHFIPQELSQLIWAVIHGSLGLALLAELSLHLVWHWNWIGAAFKRTDRPKPTQVRRNRLVDLWLFGLLILMGLSGLFIWSMAGSPLGDIAVVGVAYHVWRHLHTLGALTMFVLIPVHLALHWNWIILTARRSIKPDTHPQTKKLIKT